MPQAQTLSLTPMAQIDLTPDCARCDALCCVLLAFDASDAFGFDKPACVACRHLQGDNACAIHADLALQGFRGCVRFDCHGAGQRVTGQVFQGRSWRDDPTRLPAIADAFRTMRRLHEAVVLLDQAARLPLSAQQEQTRVALLAGLDAGRDRTEAALHDLDRGPDLISVANFFASLRDTVTPPRR